MTNAFRIAVFHGDGIGPEIMGPTVNILRQMAQTSDGYDLMFEDAAAGAAHYVKTGDALPEASMETARRADAILLSAMGLPDVRYADGTEISPQIDLRMALTLFAGVRPVTVRAGQHTPLKLPAGKEIDFVLVRESTEGLFHTQGRGEVGKNEARETLLIPAISLKNCSALPSIWPRPARQQGAAQGGSPASIRPTCSAPLLFSARSLTQRQQNTLRSPPITPMSMPPRFGWCKSLGNSM